MMTHNHQCEQDPPKRQVTGTNLFRSTFFCVSLVEFHLLRVVKQAQFCDFHIPKYVDRSRDIIYEYFFLLF